MQWTFSQKLPVKSWDGSWVCLYHFSSSLPVTTDPSLARPWPFRGLAVGRCCSVHPGSHHRVTPWTFREPPDMMMRLPLFSLRSFIGSTKSGIWTQVLFVMIGTPAQRLSGYPGTGFAWRHPLDVADFLCPLWNLPSPPSSGFSLRTPNHHFFTCLLPH